MDNNGMNYNGMNYNGMNNNGMNYNGMNYNNNGYDMNNNYGVQKTNTLAIVGLILSFVPLLSFIGWILCIVALIQIKKTGEKGKVLAIIGLVWGVLVVVIIAAILLLFVNVVWPGVKESATNLIVCSVGPDKSVNEENTNIVCGSVNDGKYICEFTFTSGESKTITCDLNEYENNYYDESEYDNNYEDYDYNNDW